MMSSLQSPVSQDQFADLVGISQPRVAQLVADGTLPRDGSAAQWLILYCERLREQAAGRGQELTIERAALARSQRIGQEIKNAVAQGQYAPIGLLADVLAAASAAMVDRLDALGGDLVRLCPQLDSASRDEVLRVIAGARTQWVRDTRTLSLEALDQLTEDDGEAAVAALDLDDDDAAVAPAGQPTSAPCFPCQPAAGDPDEE